MYEEYVSIVSKRFGGKIVIEPMSGEVGSYNVLLMLRNRFLGLTKVQLVELVELILILTEFCAKLIEFWLR